MGQCRRLRVILETCQPANRAFAHLLVHSPPPLGRNYGCDKMSEVVRDVVMPSKPEQWVSRVSRRVSRERLIAPEQKRRRLLTRSGRELATSYESLRRKVLYHIAHSASREGSRPHRPHPCGNSLVAVQVSKCRYASNLNWCAPQPLRDWYSVERNPDSGHVSTLFYGVR